MAKFLCLCLILSNIPALIQFPQLKGQSSPWPFGFTVDSMSTEQVLRLGLDYEV